MSKLLKVLDYYGIQYDEKIICPFHGDVNPSLKIDLEKDFWFCFGCQEGGDAFKFYKKMQMLKGETNELKMLMSYNKLVRDELKKEENGTIILDEPEVHLHPEWQVVFAEIIVLIQKEFNMHILINTHSPYFLNAIEVYSEKHNIVDRCKYYKAINEGSYSIIKDCTENIDEIYRQLSKPFQDLENERWKNNG